MREYSYSFKWGLLSVARIQREEITNVGVVYMGLRNHVPGGQ